MQLVVRSDPSWPSRYQPVNHVARALAGMMRVDHFTKSNLHTWLKMGGTVIRDGKPFTDEI